MYLFLVEISIDLRRAMIRVQGERFRKFLAGDHFTNAISFLWISCGEVGGWGRDPKKCTGRDWGMGSSTI